MAINSVKISELQQVTSLNENDEFFVTRGDGSVKIPYSMMSAAFYDRISSQWNEDNVSVITNVTQLLDMLSDNLYQDTKTIMKETNPGKLSGSFPTISAVKCIFTEPQTFSGECQFPKGLSSTMAATDADAVVTIKDLTYENISSAMEKTYEVYRTGATTCTELISSFYVTNGTNDSGVPEIFIPNTKTNPVICYIPKSERIDGSETLRIDVYAYSSTNKIGIYGYAGEDGYWGQDPMNPPSYETASTEIYSSMSAKKYDRFTFLEADKADGNIFSKVITVNTPVWLCVFPVIAVDTSKANAGIPYLAFNGSTVTY